MVTVYGQARFNHLTLSSQLKESNYYWKINKKETWSMLLHLEEERIDSVKFPTSKSTLGEAEAILTFKQKSKVFHL